MWLDLGCLYVGCVVCVCEPALGMLRMRSMLESPRISVVAVVSGNLHVSFSRPEYANRAGPQMWECVVVRLSAMSVSLSVVVVVL